MPITSIVPAAAWPTAPTESASVGRLLVFVIVNKRQEFNDKDERETPANAMRAEIGSEPPRKQYVEVPGGKLLVDSLR